MYINKSLTDKSLLLQPTMNIHFIIKLARTIHFFTIFNRKRIHFVLSLLNLFKLFFLFIILTLKSEELIYCKKKEFEINLVEFMVS